MRDHRFRFLVVGSLAILAVFLTVQPASACKKPDSSFVVGTDPNGVIESVTISGNTFQADDPSTDTCACGLTLPEGAMATAVEILDHNENPIAAFLGFAPNSATTGELGSRRRAAPETAWWGFNSAVDPNNIAKGQSLLRFSVSAPGMTASELRTELLRDGVVGAAQADLSGVNFDPNHTAFVPLGQEIPALSEWGMVALVAVILLGGITMVMRRRRQARAL